MSYVTGNARALAALFAVAGFAVGNNSGLVHLAAAAGARVVCLQSHLDARMWHPWGGDRHRTLSGPPDPEPCDCTVNSQGERSLPCGRTITTSAVLAALREVGAVS
jgi:ADP-heptose:LPS heptosyltransferase